MLPSTLHCSLCSHFLRVLQALSEFEVGYINPDRRFCLSGEIFLNFNKHYPGLSSKYCSNSIQHVTPRQSHLLLSPDRVVISSPHCPSRHLTLCSINAHSARIGIMTYRSTKRSELKAAHVSVQYASRAECLKLAPPLI